MPQLPQIRHELFCRALARGCQKSAAYREAGYSESASKSAGPHALAKKPHIRERISELMCNEHHILEAAQEIARHAQAISIESLLSEAESARLLAMSTANPAAAIAAIREKGVLSRLRIERAEQGMPGEFEAIDKMTIDELRAYLAEDVPSLTH